MSFKELQGAIGGMEWTPSDSERISRPTRGFQVAVAGDVALEYKDGSTCIWPACIAGVLHPHVDFVRVLATGTTATGVRIAF
jgi:hypothetical protein